MWLEQRGKIEELIKETGSPYIAVNVVARKARKLKESCNFAISDSQAVNWAITDIPPENLETLIKNRMRQDEELSETDRLDEILAMIDEDNIRIAVLNSYKASTRQHQVVFDYNGIKDKGIRTRIRILTRMAFIPELINKKQ